MDRQQILKYVKDDLNRLSDLYRENFKVKETTPILISKGLVTSIMETLILVKTRWEDQEKEINAILDKWR